MNSASKPFDEMPYTMQIDSLSPIELRILKHQLKHLKFQEAVEELHDQGFNFGSRPNLLCAMEYLRARISQHISPFSTKCTFEQEYEHKVRGQAALVKKPNSSIGQLEKKARDSRVANTTGKSFAQRVAADRQQSGKFTVCHWNLAVYVFEKERADFGVESKGSWF
jgi:hypothetical protein